MYADWSFATSALTSSAMRTWRCSRLGDWLRYSCASTILEAWIASMEKFFGAPHKMATIEWMRSGLIARETLVMLRMSFVRGAHMSAPAGPTS